MSHGPRMSNTVKTLITRFAIEEARLPRKDILDDIKQKISRMNELVPADETILKLISRARNQDNPIDKPWTLITLNEYELPAESISHVGKVWRYAILTDEPFTIREAKWVARLYASCKEIAQLWLWSREYAILERLSEINKEPMDTFPLDSAVFTSYWERVTLSHTGFRDPRGKTSHEDMRYLWEKDGDVIEELLHIVNYMRYIDADDDFLERDYNLAFLVENLPTLKSLGFTEEARLIYIRWLSYITKGKKWRKISAENALEIIVRLRELVLKLRNDLYEGLGDNEEPHPKDHLLSLETPEFYEGISELLIKVDHVHAPKGDR